MTRQIRSYAEVIVRKLLDEPAPVAGEAAKPVEHDYSWIVPVTFGDVMHHCCAPSLASRS